MSDPGADMLEDGWIASDFIDPTRADESEDDPWSVEPSGDDDAVVHSAPVQARSSLTNTDAAVADADADENSNQAACTPLTVPSNGAQTGDTLVDGDAEDEPAASDMFDDEDEGSETGLESYGDYWDEPEPLAEYDSELADALYASDGEVANPSQTLRLDALIAGIESVTCDQRNKIFEILSEFSAKRLGNWLLWLKDKEWTGDSLLLFLQFYDLWSETPQWWEYSVWSRWLDQWWTYSSRGVLSRDECYELIQRRLDCQPDEVIDETWFHEWDSLALWKHGFYSFASFALFRAGLNPGEDWMSRVSAQSDAVR